MSETFASGTTAIQAPKRLAPIEDHPYEVRVEACRRKVSIRFAGEIVAESQRALVVRETRLPPVYYFPRSDVRMSVLVESTHHSYCPFKGTAHYWHLDVAGQRSENAVWSYPDPLPEAAEIAGYLAFYDSHVDSLTTEEGDLSLETLPEARVTENPFLAWLLREAWEATTAEELAGRFARRLKEGGFPIWRLNILLGTLNPQVSGTAFIWRADSEELQVRRILHERRRSPSFTDSPLAVVYRGDGGVRRRLEGDDARLDFPILKEFKEEGATDYIAMPMPFSDGHVNAITLASDRPGGFSTDDLGQLYEILPLLSRLFEVHALKHTARSLMDTYLGSRTADLVLGGRIERGDGTTIPAVIWHADLKGSSRLAEGLPRELYLKGLNAFFEAAAGAAMRHEGEVLKFIGDAVLAIFPISDCKIRTGKACENALNAALETQAALEALKIDGWPEDRLEARIALHKGEVTYGNVGAKERLDFTVIGPAANETARIGELCRELGQTIVLSDDVAGFLDRDLQSLGQHCLRNIGASHEIFTLSDQNRS